MARSGADQGERHPCGKSDGPRLPAGRVESGGDIERQDLVSRTLKPAQEIRRLALERTREAKAEKTIGEHRLGPRRPGPKKRGHLRARHDPPARLAIAFAGGAGRRRSGLPPGKNDRIPPCFKHPAGERVAVAPVVARPAEDEEVARPGPTASQEFPGRLPGPLHECLGSKPETPLGFLFEPPMGRHRIDPPWT